MSTIDTPTTISNSISSSGTFCPPTTIEDLDLQNFLSDKANVERTLYGEDFEILGYDENSSIKKYSQKIALKTRHDRKAKCCSHIKKKDILIKHNTKMHKPCGCHACVKCIPSRREKLRSDIYHKYGPIIYAKYVERFNVSTNEDIDRLFNNLPLEYDILINAGRTNITVRITGKGIVVYSNDINQLPTMTLEEKEKLTEKTEKLRNILKNVFNKTTTDLNANTRLSQTVLSDYDKNILIEDKIKETIKETEDVNNIQIIYIEGDISTTDTDIRNKFLDECVYFDVSQDIEDYMYDKYYNHWKVRTMGKKVYKEKEYKIMSAEEGTAENKDNIFYAMSAEPGVYISEEEANTLPPAVYVPINDDTVDKIMFGIHTGNYITFRELIKLTEWNNDNPYFKDWVDYFGTSKRSTTIYKKFKKKYK